MDVIKKTNESIIFRLTIKSGQQVVSLGLGIVLARILSPVEFGVIAISNMIIHYANNFTNFGLNNALIQKDDIGDIHINTVFTIDLAISLLFALITWQAAERISLFFHNPDVAPVLRWMSIYYIITTFYHIPVIILRRNIDFRFLTLAEFLESTFTSLAAIGLALAGYGYWAIVIASLVMPSLVAVVLIFKTRWLPRLIIGRQMHELYNFAFWNFIGAQVQLLVSKVDYFVIGRYLDIRSLGLYEKSFELTDRSLTGLTTPLNSVFFTTFCRIKHSNRQLKQVVLDACSLLALINFPALFGIIGVAPHFVLTCLGSQWAQTVIPLQILATACLFRVLPGMFASFNIAVGKFKAHTVLNIIAALIFIFLCLLMVPLGIVAISIAYLIYSITSFGFNFRLVHINTGITILELLQSIWYPLVGSLLMLGTILFLRHYILTDYSSLTQLAILVVIGAAIYLGWCCYYYKKGIICFRIDADNQIIS